MRNEKNEKFITLKEASEISGYDPDYIGQLIRKGRLSGKQVYCNVAWVTTGGAIKKYIEQEVNNSSKGFVARKLQQARAELSCPKKLPKIFKLSLYLSVGVLTLFVIFLFYIFSVNLDKKIQEKTISKLDAQLNKYEDSGLSQNSRLPITY